MQHLQQNSADLLDRDFVGTAKDRLSDTIHDQVTTGISTRYLDRSHDLQIVFYSPEGLSVQLVDNVEYEVQILDHGKLADDTENARALRRGHDSGRSAMESTRFPGGA